MRRGVKQQIFYSQVDRKGGGGVSHLGPDQSVTSRLETSRYRDFSQFFESIGLGLENFGLENI